MRKHIKYAYTRFYGELKDHFDGDLYAENLRDALLLIVADFNDIYAHTEDEAKQKATEWLNEKLGEGWTIEDYFDNPPELWTDRILYRMDGLLENGQ